MTIGLKAKTRKFLNQETWFHGTTLNVAKALKTTKVFWDYNSGNELDFGPGFYLSPKQKWASDYIIRMNEPRIEALKALGIEVTEEMETPVVIEFSFNVRKYALTHRVGIRVYEDYDREFGEFVFRNRINAEKGLIHRFPLVYGVVCDSKPSILLKQYREAKISKEAVIDEIVAGSIGARQLSIHRQSICDKLKIVKVYSALDGKEMDV